jgi:hypothetical protein
VGLSWHVPRSEPLTDDDLTTIVVAIGRLASDTALVGEFYHVAVAG